MKKRVLCGGFLFLFFVLGCGNEFDIGQAAFPQLLEKYGLDNDQCFEAIGHENAIVGTWQMRQKGTDVAFLHFSERGRWEEWALRKDALRLHQSGSYRLLQCHGLAVNHWFLHLRSENNQTYDEIIVDHPNMQVLRPSAGAEIIEYKKLRCDLLPNNPNETRAAAQLRERCR